MRNAGRRSASCVVAMGAATILCVLIMRFAGGGNVLPYKHPNEFGFDSAMLWLELSSTPDEVFKVLGPIHSERGDTLRAALDATNIYDLAFMGCYGLFNAFLILFVTRLNSYRLRGLVKLKTFMVLGFILCMTMVIGDVVENVTLTTLTHAQSADEISMETMSQLMYWTRVKWGSLFLLCLMLSSAYTAYFWRIPPLLLPAGLAIAGVSGLLALSIPEARGIMESIALPHLAVVWAASLVHAGFFAYRGPHPDLLAQQAVQAQRRTGITAAPQK